MARPAIIDLHADLAAWVLDMDLAQGSLHEHHEDERRDKHGDDAENHSGRESAHATLLEELRQRAGEFRNDADIDDERDTVTDAARRDLLPQRHQEHGAADQRDDGRDTQEPARIGYKIARFHRNRQTVSLNGRQKHRAVAGVLRDLATPLLAFFLQLLQRAPCGAEKLHDDRGRNVRHDAERKDTHPRQRAAGEEVEDTADTACRLLHKLPQGNTVDARDGNVGPQPVDDQQTQSEQKAFAKLRGFAQHAPTDVGCHLFGGRCHKRPLLCVCAAVRFPGQRRWKT